MRFSDALLIAGFFAALGFFGWALLRALDRPEVVVSYSTGECRQVLFMDGTRGDCARLPAEYDVVWGE